MMAECDEFAGVTSAEWLAWLERVDRKLDKYLDKLCRPGLPEPEARDAVRSRLCKLEERVANIERKLDISTAYEPN
jgi:hypothetical protein